ncbi:MAG: hypothetical protein ACLR3C_02950 [Eggerthella lenta]
MATAVTPSLACSSKAISALACAPTALRAYSSVEREDAASASRSFADGINVLLIDEYDLEVAVRYGRIVVDAKLPPSLGTEIQPCFQAGQSADLSVEQGAGSVRNCVRVDLGDAGIVAVDRFLHQIEGPAQPARTRHAAANAVAMPRFLVIRHLLTGICHCLVF